MFPCRKIAENGVLGLFVFQWNLFFHSIFFNVIENLEISGLYHIFEALCVPQINTDIFGMVRIINYYYLVYTSLILPKNLPVFI